MVRFIRTGFSDYLDFIIDGQIVEVIKAILIFQRIEVKTWT